MNGKNTSEFKHFFKPNTIIFLFLYFLIFLLQLKNQESTRSRVFKGPVRAVGDDTATRYQLSHEQFQKSIEQVNRDPVV